MSIKNDGHYFCRAGGNRPDGLNEPVTNKRHKFSPNGTIGAAKR
ncbi:TPA: copper resistance protein [Klebsiella pneumoniae]|nr:copper resistance protein [Klebsiella pneumoniae]